ncbi:MAG: rhodanese-like domain-containing protein [Verrucomicrobiales bacterium]|nr:rhodanese-like domain-containing protein [Verrucomicrobiales bacterium]
MSRRYLLWIVSIFAIAAILLKVTHCSYAQLSESLTMESITKKILSKFTKVQHITTADLAKELKQADSASSILLIDSRAPEEFAISHLPNSRNLQTAKEVQTYLATLSEKPQRIVIYCSVGYRSADLAEKVIKNKDNDIPVQNLLGSIFSWANEGRPLVKQDQGKDSPTDQVHPFNKKWGRLLKPEHRADLD